MFLPAAAEGEPCQYELELKRKQDEELRKQQENQNTIQEEFQNDKKEDEQKKEKNKDKDVGMEGASDTRKGDESEISVNSADMDNKKPVEVPEEINDISENIQEKVTGNEISKGTEVESEATGQDISESDKASDAELEGRINAPSYEVEIPSQVVLVENMNSFDIQTRRLCQEEAGSLLVTVEGTQSPDGENFALYCGEESWEYQLEMGGNILTPQKNQTILEACDSTQRVNIIPQENINLMAGSYTGVLTFRVVYENNIGN